MSIPLIKSDHLSFWQKHPALSLGISALLGAFAFFEAALWPALLWSGYQLLLSRSKGCLNTATLLFIALYCHQLFSPEPASSSGTAYFSIHSVQAHSSPFHQGWLYKGTLRAFQTKNDRYCLCLPCSALYRGDPKLRPKATGSYLLTGKLQQRDRFDYSFQAKDWEPVPHTLSLAELRFSAKERIRTILNTHLHELNTAPFLTALFTGDIEERSLRYEFGKLGLQHILAISGFHFAILAAFVTVFLRLILPFRARLWVLLFAISLYFLFVGNSPAVQRSFLAASLFLASKLLQRRTSGLNLLGACLLIEILLDPLVVRQIGFQLSFLSCFGILLFHAPMQRLFCSLFPRRRFSELIRMDLASQCAYIASTFFSRALYLTLAVNLALGPLLLHHFHRFPWLSLLYNLFIPQLAALCLFLLLLTLAIHAFHPLFALPLFKITDLLTGEVLELIAHPPALLDYSLSLAFPGWAVAPYLGVLLIAGIYFQERRLGEKGAGKLIFSN